MTRSPLRHLPTLLLIATLVAGFSISRQRVEAHRAPQNGAGSPVPSSASDGAPVDVERIIHAFTAKETEFRRALAEYAFQRDATIQTVGMGGQLTGEDTRKP